MTTHEHSAAQSYCWVTLITRPSYLAGAIILGQTLAAHGSKYPLLVLYTDTLGDESLKLLEIESNINSKVVLHHVELLLPRADQENVGSVADRFKDTFTKLRAFEIHKLGYTKACFLDADMAVFRDPDEIFAETLPDDWIGANHACVCNLDYDSWAPTNWHKGNCAYTTLNKPEDVARAIVDNSRPTYHLLNSGMFLYNPSQALWNDMLLFFNTTDKLKTYQFPDQDFLDDFFYNKWKPLSWKYNAIKTMRYWHPRLWSDSEVVIVHYIVDKPWVRRVSDEGIAGHLGRDGETHAWWWKIYDGWFEARTKSNVFDQACVAHLNSLVDTEEPIHVFTPLPQTIGQLSDVTEC